MTQSDCVHVELRWMPKLDAHVCPTCGLFEPLVTDPRDSGCLCGRCARRYRVDVMVPDALWSKIAGSSELLCPRCIGDALEALGVFAAYRLEGVP